MLLGSMRSIRDNLKFLFTILCFINSYALADICSEPVNMGTISPCNYLQDPFGLIGLSTQAGSNGSYDLGISAIYNNSINT